MYETDFTKGVYKLEDFCNALKDNNCIVVRNVFNDWQTLADSTKYDSIRFVITAVHGEMKFGFWIACKHDLIITDYTKQQWLDFFCLSKETEDVWERLLFQSAVKPVEKDYWNKVADKSIKVTKSNKRTFKIDEVFELIKKNLKNLSKSKDCLDMMQDILDLQNLKSFSKNNEDIYFEGYLWCIEVKSFGEINRWTLPKWIGDLLNDECDECKV